MSSGSTANYIIFWENILGAKLVPKIGEVNKQLPVCILDESKKQVCAKLI